MILADIPVFTLAKNEAAYCEQVGYLRYTANLGRPNSYALSRDGRDEEVLGAYGEYVVSLWLDRSWRAVVDNPWTEIDGDVGRLQVRTTFNARDPHLICHTKDPDEAIFVLVSRQDWCTFRIEGWTLGKEAKNPARWGDKYMLGRPAFFTPAADLYDPGTLPARLSRTI